LKEDRDVEIKIKFIKCGKLISILILSRISSANNVKVLLQQNNKIEAWLSVLCPNHIEGKF